MTGAGYLTGRARLAGVMGWPVGAFALAAPPWPLAAPPRHRRRLRAARGTAGSPGAGAARPARPELSRLQSDHPAQGAGARPGRPATPAARAGSARSTPSWSSPTARSSATTPTASASSPSLTAAPAWRAEAGPAVLLGAGGAARAVAVALLDAGAPEVRLLNRTPDRAHALAAELARSGAAVPWRERAAALDGAALLVNTTSLGMAGSAAAGPGARCPAAHARWSPTSCTRR